MTPQDTANDLPDAAALLDAVDAVVWEARASDARFVFVSDQSERILGHPARRWLEEPGFWAEHLHPADRAATLARWHDAARSEAPTTIEYRLRRADGGYAWVSQRISRRVTPDGEARLCGLLVDVSVRRVAEQAYAEQALLFEAVFHHVPDPLAIVDAERRIRFVNPAFERVFGYRLDEVAGRTASVLYESDTEFERLGRERFNVLGPDSEEPVRVRMRRRDGEVFPVETYGSIIRDGAGAPLGYLGVMRDITARERAERELRASEGRFRDFASAASDWYWEMDSQLRFSYFSERFTEVTGVLQGKLLGRTREETGIPGVDDAVWRKHLDDLAAHRPFRRFVHPRLLPDGRTVWLSISGVPTYDDDGTFLGYRGTGTDITARVQMEAALRESEARFRQFAEMGADYFWETDAQLRFTRLYGGVEDAWGRTGESMLGRSRLKLVLPCLEPVVATEHARTLAERRPFQGLELRIPQPGGSERIVEVSGCPVYDDGAFTGYRGASRDVTEERRMAKQLAHQATHDALTGLVNRREFERRLQATIERAATDGGEHAVCYLDLDQFKLVNDTCGHAAGDELLRQVATLLARSLRAGDLLARLGGDEFGVLLPDCPLAGARVVAENLRGALESFRFAWDGKPFTLGASIGVVPLASRGESVARVLSAADSACYVSKDAGRNRVHVVDTCDGPVSRRRTEMAWVASITRALQEDRFELWQQPIVALHAEPGAGSHFEVLVRLRGDGDETVSPGVFLPAAERYGIASRIDRWVVDSILAWFRRHPGEAGRVATCSVNLSGQSLCDEGFLEHLRQVLPAAAIPAARLCFEITETAAIQNLGAASRFIGTLKSLGCRFALDDFGSGVSSFAYLKTLDVDYLKLDGMFVKDMDTDAVSLAMVRSINEVGQVMGKRTIAEFVESPAIVEHLRGIGVDFAQGYAIGRPAPLAPRVAARTDERAGAVTALRLRRARA